MLADLVLLRFGQYPLAIPEIIKDAERIPGDRTQGSKVRNEGPDRKRSLIGGESLQRWELRAVQVDPFVFKKGRGLGRIDARKTRQRADSALIGNVIQH